MGGRGEESGVGDSLLEVDRFASSLDAEAARYWSLHRTRFEWLANFACRCAPENGDYRLLDVGNSFQTVLLKAVLPYSQVDTIGFFDHRFAVGECSRHIEMDLNDAYDVSRWPKLEGDGYDLIVFAEVVEHLYTSPEQILNCLKSLLRPNGRVLLQTPNAAALKKRLRLLSGENPYELIRLDRTNPGHFRELTVADLRRYADRCGLQVESVWMDSNLIDGKRFDRVCDHISRWLPGPLRGGISMSLRLV
ncbi:methyltransferase domain-containing protein [Pelagicoccus sp. SDUM812002]|uniref:class I SAM-dependent methyltransferase n=1 Tax=Pelagicoccus sp. SDUM812002 TaxID=3041266 RepID=UPI00280D912B|nr:methyltransferase domain-containing protein [Pelagicoccus sp. SDUM812002]MDQ8186061.1 methyltransferase domain-containing protein [Pelagicoccus sp. SDUM812002]